MDEQGYYFCFFHLIAKKFSQNEEKIFIPYGSCEMSVTLNTYPLFFISAIKNRLSTAKESATLVSLTVFSEHWICCM